MTGSGEAVLEVEHLTKRYDATVLAVDDLGFSVERGQVCGLLGPNGAGKTTTLRMLVGLVRPSSGEARLFGERVVPSMPALARVGALIEGAAFAPYLSGITNLRLWWESNGASWDDADVDEALAVAGLGAAVERKVKTYSHGMKQRLGIARSLLGRPELLVLDEPATGLDPQELREIRRLLRRLADRGVTILLSSHLLSEVEISCSHVVVMDRGHLVATGSVPELVGAGARSVYVEVDDPALADGPRDPPDGARRHGRCRRVHARARRRGSHRGRVDARARRRRRAHDHRQVAARGRVPRPRRLRARPVIDR